MYDQIIQGLQTAHRLGVLPDGVDHDALATVLQASLDTSQVPALASDSAVPEEPTVPALRLEAPDLVVAMAEQNLIDMTTDTEQSVTLTVQDVPGTDTGAFAQFVLPIAAMFGVLARTHVYRDELLGPIRMYRLAGTPDKVMALRLTLGMFTTPGEQATAEMTREQAEQFWATAADLVLQTTRAQQVLAAAASATEAARAHMVITHGPARRLPRAEAAQADSPLTRTATGVLTQAVSAM